MTLANLECGKMMFVPCGHLNILNKYAGDIFNPLFRHLVQPFRKTISQMNSLNKLSCHVTVNTGVLKWTNTIASNFFLGSVAGEGI